MKLFIFFAAIIAIFCVAWLLNQYAAENAALKEENDSLEAHNNELWDENIHLKDYFNAYNGQK